MLCNTVAGPSLPSSDLGSMLRGDRELMVCSCAPSDAHRISGFVNDKKDLIFLRVFVSSRSMTKSVALSIGKALGNVTIELPSNVDGVQVLYRLEKSPGHVLMPEIPCVANKISWLSIRVVQLSRALASGPRALHHGGCSTWGFMNLSMLSVPPFLHQRMEIEIKSRYTFWGEC